MALLGHLGVLNYLMVRHCLLLQTLVPGPVLGLGPAGPELEPGLVLGLVALALALELGWVGWVQWVQWV